MTSEGCTCGPGYATPLDAVRNSPKEKLIYITCIQPNGRVDKKHDYLATVDVDPESPTYCQVIHRLHTTHFGDELHHSGWNACSSCHGDKSRKRDTLVLPSLVSDRVYLVDTATDPRAPRLRQVVDREEMRALGVATPHTSHCLPSGEVMISVMGDTKGDGLGDFVLLDPNTGKFTGRWIQGETKGQFGYDFWYQPYWDVLISSEWGAPKCFGNGFKPEYVDDPKVYGRSLNLFSWSERRLLQTIPLGVGGTASLEIRFLHDPRASQGFVGCAVYAKVYRFFRKEDGTWDAEVAISVPEKEVEGWMMPKMQGMITDILISMDDRFLYFSNFLHGDVRQYDITDPTKPRLVCQVFLGGSIQCDGPVKVVQDVELKEQPEPVFIKGRRLYGSPQMLQLSLDGKRLYVSSALYSPWDKQFYPEHVKHGSWIVQLDIDTDNGGMKLNPDFLVDFGKEPEGPVLAHEMRYPGGDCTSDIYLVEDKQ